MFFYDDSLNPNRCSFIKRSIKNKSLRSVGCLMIQCILFLPQLSVLDTGFCAWYIVYPRMATFSADPVFLLWVREGSDTRPGAWYMPNHFVPLYSVKAYGFHKSDQTWKDEPTTRPFNGNCRNKATGVNIGTNNREISKRKQRYLGKSVKRKKVMKASRRPIGGGV